MAEPKHYSQLYGQKKMVNPFISNIHARFMRSDVGRRLLEGDERLTVFVVGEKHELDLFEDHPALNVNGFLSFSTAVLGKTGSGKSVTGARIIEQLARNGVSFSIFDREGDYLTIKDLYPNIVIIGNGEGADKNFGEFADGGFERLANTVVLERREVIFDFSSLLDEEVKRKMALDYSKALWNIIDKIRVPHVLVVDEAHKFAPREGLAGQKWLRELVGMFEQIATMGRKRGFGFVILSQRPADLSTRVITQVRARILHKVDEKPDMDRYKELLKFMGDKDLFYDIMDAIPAMNAGEAIFAVGGNVEMVMVKFRDSDHTSGSPTLEDYEKLDRIEKGDWDTLRI